MPHAVPMPVQSLDTVLMAGTPLSPPSLAVDLKKAFKNVIMSCGREPTAEEYASADVISCFLLPKSLVHIDQMPRLKFFQATSAGYAHITKSPFYQSIPEDRDITFASASGIHVAAIGEHVIGSIINLWHKLHTLLLRGNREQHWINTITDPDFGRFHIREIRGATIGIIGYGHIGREVARMAGCLGATVIALTRSGRPTKIKGYTVPGTGDDDGTLPSQYYTTSDPSSVSGFLGRCDVVCVTLPSSKENYRWCGREMFEAMKGDALFINIGRGDTVDQEVLIEALNAKTAEGEEKDAIGTLRIGAASLDVTDPEPLPDGHPLFTMPNVMLTPHMCGLSSTYQTLCIDVMLKNKSRLEGGLGALNAWKGRCEE